MRDRSALSRNLESAGRWTNLIVAGAAFAQFYVAGLAVFGATDFTAHARVGWLVQLASLITSILLLSARVPFRVSRLALLILVIGILQPVFAFGLRFVPALAALHPLNGVVLLGTCLLLEWRLRGRS
jgi:hypothetical protein